MTTDKIKNMVDMAVALDREIADRAERLKVIKAALIAEAKGRKTEHVKTDGGGTSWTHDGNNGDVARVTFPGKTLKGSIDGEGKGIESIRQIAGNAFARLFLQSPKYVPVDDFRLQAKAILGSEAAKLIKHCESKSSPRLSFETKEIPKGG